MDNIVMKRGDTLPALRYALDPATVDLTGAAVTALMRVRNGASVALSGATSVVIQTGAPTVEYAWTEADTAVAGLYEFEFEVIFPGGGRMTFPRAGFIQVQMIQDIEAVAPVAPPVNTALPVITGAPIVGQVLTASAGVWTGAPTGFAFQWQRNGAAIAGATSAAYALVSADIGAAIRVQVTATNAAGAAAAISAATAAVLPLAPVNAELPTISGTAQVGQTLTISPGTWANAPTSFAAVLSNGATPAGAGPWTYVVPEAALGLTLAATVTASNAGGASAPATSAATSAVIAATVPPPVNTAPPTITGTAQVGQTLTGTEGAWTGSPTITLQWLRGSTAISGATGLTYVPITEDVGAALSLRATATNAGGSVVATSAATAAVAAAGGAPSFDFELLTEAGSPVIAAVPNLRISIDNGTTWNPLASVPGHTLSLARGADGRSLVISGWTGGIVPAGLRVHLKQRIPGEPNPGTGVAGVITELFARRLGGPAPQNPAQSGGLAVSSTYHLAPVGVS